MVLEFYTQCQRLTDAGGQSKCHAERSQALEQARRPQESMFVPECNEDGTFAQVCFTALHLPLIKTSGVRLKKIRLSPEFAFSCLCRSSVTRLQATAGASPVMANQ